MEAKTYNIDNLKTHQMFYMLDSITDDSLQLFRRTPAGDEEFFAYDLFRMPDGKLLVAFYRYWEFQNIHSLVAVCGDKEEYVSAIPFERIVPYWNPTTDYNNQGAFAFFGSRAINVGPDAWRCDNTFYGPEQYITTEGILRYKNAHAGELVVYEPIININGVSSLMYASTSDEEYVKNIYINEDFIPSTTITLSEMFRLISEWALLADAPFNSTEPISLDAKEFLRQIGFDSSLVADQVDMQVAEYFKGNTDARKRPSGVVETNQALLSFVKRKMAHMSLCGVLSCYPEYSNLEAEIQRDINSVNNEFLQDISNMRIEGDYSFANYEDALDFIPNNYVDGKQTYTFRWGLLKRKKDFALSMKVF